MSERARILVVDDEIGPRESLRMILKPSYDIAMADSGDTALKTLEAFSPDLVFMDIKMPKMDGIELLRRIKAIDPTIEAVMITAYASLDTVKNALTHGAFEYLIKPFSRIDLEETVRRALIRRQTELGKSTQLSGLVNEMRALSTKTRTLEEEARREQAEQALRVTQLSILREISNGILRQLDLAELTAGIAAQLKESLGYDEAQVLLGEALPEGIRGEGAIVCPIRDNGVTVGFLLAANRSSSRPIDPREHELLEMLADSLAVAIRNSRLYGELAENKRSLEQLVRSAGDAIISIDRRGNITGWNPAAERIFGLTAKEAIGRSLRGMFPERYEQAARLALTGAQPASSFDLSANRPDGGTLNLAVTLSGVPGRDGRVAGLLAIVRDMTKQRELETQMHQSEKLTALGQVAGGIAHDFNNLLQAILGYSQLMSKNMENADVVRQALSDIETAAADAAERVRQIQKFARLRPDEPFVSVELNQAINLVQAILGYSQLISKNMGNVDVVRRGLSVIETAATGGAETVRRIQKFARLRPDEPFVLVELNQVIEDAVAITRPRWEERVAKGGVPLRLDLRLAPLPDVMGRPSELNEVVTNLILNAIDAMPHGGTLSIYTRPEGDEHVVLTVADTGVGMAEQVRKRIFDPFFTTKGEVGTGLGLSVSYSIIQRHSGEMRVESAPGRGTTFTIVLQVAKPDDTQAPVGPEVVVGTRSGRILLVDNELPVMTILGEMLTEAGHHVLPVASGAEAVRVFVPGGFDLVMTNLGMRGMTGWDVAERVRASDPQVPVVFITGWGLQAEDRERCRKLGVINVLFKPVRPAELHTAVQEALAVSGRRKRGPAA